MKKLFSQILIACILFVGIGTFSFSAISYAGADSGWWLVYWTPVIKEYDCQNSGYAHHEVDYSYNFNDKGSYDEIYSRADNGSCKNNSGKGYYVRATTKDGKGQQVNSNTWAGWNHSSSVTQGAEKGNDYAAVQEGI